MEVLKEGLRVDAGGAAVTQPHPNRKWSSNWALSRTLPGIPQGQVQGSGLCWNWPGGGNATNQTAILHVCFEGHTHQEELMLTSFWYQHHIILFVIIAQCPSFWNNLQGELRSISFSKRLFCLLLAKITFKDICYGVMKLKGKDNSCYKKLEF